MHYVLITAVFKPRCELYSEIFATTKLQHDRIRVLWMDIQCALWGVHRPQLKYIQVWISVLKIKHFCFTVRTSNKRRLLWDKFGKLLNRLSHVMN